MITWLLLIIDHVYGYIFIYLHQILACHARVRLDHFFQLFNFMYLFICLLYHFNESQLFSWNSKWNSTL